jgi:phosphatidylinositol alpha-1,6-mannosyltransferase
MKILLMTDSFLPHAGGSRVYYHNLYKRMTQRFFDRVTILTKKVPGWQEFDREESSGALQIVRKYLPLPNHRLRQIPKGLLSFLEALRLLFQERPDAIHCGDLFPPALAGLLLKRLFGVPYLVYCHGEEITQIDRRHYQPLVRDHIYRNADGVVAASSFAQQNLIRIGVSPDRIRQITPGVECDRFQPRPRNADLVRRYGLEGKRVLLTVGRLVRRKGHDVVLQALSALAPEFPDLRYVIVGEGPEREGLERQCKDLGIPDKVLFVGGISNEELPDFYNLGDIFVMTNRESRGDIEGFGMVFLEASASGKPVIGGLSGGAGQAIQHGVTGLLVDPENPVEVASNLKRLLLDPSLMQRMGDAGLRRVREEFDWESRCQALRDFSLEILERAKGRRRTQSRVAPYETGSVT